MKVLFLTKYHVLRYGAAGALQGLAAGLRKAGIQVCVYSSHPSAAEGRMPGGEVCRHGPLPRPGLLPSRGTAAIARFAEEQRVDVVHAHGLYRPGLAARMLRRRTGLPYVVTSHGDLWDERRLRRGRVRRRYRAVLRTADAVTHLTPAMAERASELAGPGAAGRIIPNGVHLPWWRRPADSMPGRFILAVGQLVEQKGHATLLEALAELAGRGSPLNLILAGQGEQEAALRQRADRLGLSVLDHLDELAKAPGGAVCFAGFVEGERKRRLFRSARVVALPSLRGEAFPLVIVEAIAAGRPIVWSELPFARGLVEPGRHGLTAPPGDARRWADALDRLDSDAPLRAACEEHNLREADAYDWPAIAEQYAAVYRRIAANAPPEIFAHPRSQRS